VGATPEAVAWALRDDETLSEHARTAWLMLWLRGPDAHPSTATLAANCGVSVRTVNRALAELAQAGWLTIERRHAPSGAKQASRYYLHAPGEAVPDATPASPAETHVPAGHTYAPERRKGYAPLAHKGLKGEAVKRSKDSTPPLPGLLVGVAKTPPAPPREPNARDVTAAYVDAARERHGHDPADRSIARVARDAKRLLGQGIVSSLLIEAATSLGQTPWDNLPRQLDIISEGRRPPVIREVPLTEVEETVACVEVPGVEYEVIDPMAYEEIV